MTSINDVLKASKGLHVDDILAELWGRKLSSDYTIDVYTGTLPAVLAGTKAGYLHGYKIYGNTEQTGTPTPENPIEPSECGERTKNLFDFSQAVPRKYIDAYGVEQESAAVIDYSATSHSGYMPVSFSKNYVFDAKLSRDLALNHYITFCWFDGNYDFISRDVNSVTGVKNSYTVYGTPPSANAAYCIMNFTGYSEECRFTFMEGSTAPTSYEPYGYKLPLTSAGQSVDIYLGESQTTRQIKKLVLTGEENVTYLSVSGLSKFAISLYTTIDYRIGLCSHYNYEYRNADGNIYHESAAGGLLCFIFDNDYSSSSAFKAYLAQQYANGTPVTVWYVLATEETGTLNEPLRKIGNYADTIDSTQTTAQIPTTAGSTTISWAGSGLEPSEVEFEYESR